jgi:hypothetical protein
MEEIKRSSAAGTRPMRFSDLPDILAPSDLVAYLPIGKNAVYELLRRQEIPNLRVTTRRIIITKESLGKYLGLIGEASPPTQLEKGAA